MQLPIFARLVSLAAILAAMVVPATDVLAAGGVLKFNGANAVMPPIIGANLAPSGTLIDFSSQFDGVTYAANNVIDNTPAGGPFWDQPGQFWLTAYPPAPSGHFVTLDLGSLQSIGRITVVPTSNFGGSPSAVVNQFRLRAGTAYDASTDTISGVVFDTTSTFPNLASVPSSMGSPRPEFTFDFGIVDARYVKFDILSLYGSPPYWAGLNELQVFEASLAPLAPEPSSIVLFGVLLATIAGVYWRRRRATLLAA